MNGSSTTDPRQAYIDRLAHAHEQPPDVTIDDGNGGDISSPRHNDGHDDDPRAAYVRRLTSDGVPHFGDKRMNDGRSERVHVADEGRVVQFHDSVTLADGWTKETNQTLGAAIKRLQEKRKREREQHQREQMLQGGMA